MLTTNSRSSSTVDSSASVARVVERPETLAGGVGFEAFPDEAPDSVVGNSTGFTKFPK